jgi:cytochrome c oxidase subunit III
VAEHSTAVAHHFEDLDQQRDAAELGMWLFLATELMFFGGLFLAYTVYRQAYPTAFAHASQTLNVTLGAINTAVLLTSSLTMALAVRAAHDGQRGKLIGLLMATAALGAVFLSVKAYEYAHKYHEHHMPFTGLHFEWPAEELKGAVTYFNLYFVMTGLHALHMVIGIGVLLTLAVLAWRGGLLRERATTVHNVGLYWHFVDLVWVYLFPFLYLIAARGGGGH